MTARVSQPAASKVQVEVSVRGSATHESVNLFCMMRPDCDRSTQSDTTVKSGNSN
jgi:hypothetical protein